MKTTSEEVLLAPVSQQIHAFVKPGPCPCCGRERLLALANGLDEELARAGLRGSVVVRVTKRDLGACGALLVVHPGAVVYAFSSRADVREILSEHVIHGRPVQRLCVGYAQ
jgi:NADP-reducing hydrogenase subunit HndC